MNYRLSGAILACLGGLTFMIGVPSKAADLDNVLLGQPTTADFIEKLSPRQKTRGITRGISRTPPAVDLPIVNFEFDSSVLTPGALKVLDRLAEALLSRELEDSRFLIEGHTDSIGTERYNQSLSERRAKSVGAYLASKSIDASRFQLIGKGEDELLDRANGRAPINRRVRVINLDG